MGGAKRLGGIGYERDPVLGEDRHDRVGELRPHSPSPGFNVVEELPGNTDRPGKVNLRQAGGDAEMMYLPMLGIKGNSHMLMQDRNNLDLADLLLAWIDNHVESKQAQKGAGKR